MEIIPLSLSAEPDADKNVLRAVWTVPGSKSITNRALILCALSNKKTILKGEFCPLKSSLWTGLMFDILRGSSQR